MLVKNIINSNIYTVNVSDSIEKALQMMTELKLNGVPVVDSEDRLVGIVVKADIFRFLIAPGHYGTCPVEWVMTKSVVTVKPDENVLNVAKKLREHNIVAMPVVKNEKVLGLITIEKLLDYFLNLEAAK